MKKSIGSGRGSVYNIILKALQTGDKYGYEICKEVEEKTNGAYILKQPSLYSGLKRLEAQNEVESYWRDSLLGGRRHYYTLTEKGRNRIENSNFNWQDARDEIVGGLFEKSELEKTIQSVESDIDQIKSTSLFDENIRQSASEVISSTENLAKEYENSSKVEKEAKYEEKPVEKEQTSQSFEEQEETEKDDEIDNFDSSANDLFSIFGTVADTENEEVEEEKETDEESEISSYNGEDDVEETEPIEEEHKNGDLEQPEQENNEQIDLFSFVEQPETENNIDEILTQDNEIQKSEENENIELVENKDEQKVEQIEDVNDQNNWQDIEDNLKTTKVENYENVEHDDEILSHDEQTENEVLLEKNSQDVIEEYKKSNFNFNSYIDNSLTEEETTSFFAENQVDNYSNPQDENSLFETNFELSEAEQNVEPKSEVIENEFVENHSATEKAENQDTILENVIEYENENKPFESEEKVEETKQAAVDYKDIFGDLISSGNSDAVLDDELVYNASQQADKENQNDFEKVENNDFESKEYYENKNQHAEVQQIKELPRNEESIKDINRTLMFDTNSQKKASSADFEKYDQTPFKETNSFESYSNNPFEKYDTYQNIDENVKNTETNSANYSQKTDKMSFDKKYANANNKFEVPDYEVRYFRKNNVQNNVSKFLSINKLNLVQSFILSLLICLITTVLLVVVATKVEISGFQMFMYILSYLIAFGILIFNFLKYASNKNKKIQKLPRHESMYSTFVAIVLVILSLAINLFMGMNFDNIVAYFGSLLLPIFYALIILINYPLKKFLSKSASFYN